MSSMFSTRQVRTLHYTSLASAILSIMGSGIVIVLSSRRGRWRKINHRILIGMSVMDIIKSLRLIIFYPSLSRVPSPICTAEGFLFLASLSVALFNGALAIYYALVVVHGKSEGQIARIWEKGMVLVCVVYPILIGLVGLPMKIYNPSDTFGPVCTANAYPQGCESSADLECERGNGANLFAWIAVVGPYLGAMFVIVYNNAMIYRHVLKLEKKTRRYSITSVTESQDEKEKQRQVATQSFLYVATFFVTYVFSFALRVLFDVDTRGIHRGTYFPLQVLDSIFYPLHGFWTMLVYIRPRCLRYLRSLQQSNAGSVLHLQSKRGNEICSRSFHPPDGSSGRLEGHTGTNYRRSSITFNASASVIQEMDLGEDNDSDDENEGGIRGFANKFQLIEKDGGCPQGGMAINEEVHESSSASAEESTG
jgi:hypothetical protein